MAFLALGKKEDLLERADELDVKIASTCKVKEIRKAILANENNIEEEAVIAFSRIIEDRIEREKESKRIEEIALEMKRLEVSANTDIRIIDFAEREGESNQKIQLLKITPKFDEKRDVMGLYLVNFEKRAEMAGVNRVGWVPYLLSVLPPEISNMMPRELSAEAKNYNYVKSIILKRYKMNSE